MKGFLTALLIQTFSVGSYTDDQYALAGTYFNYDDDDSSSDDYGSNPSIPQNAKTIIIVLGQCLLPTGEPHQYLIQRVNTAYSLLEQNKLDIDTTYFIVSGSDDSNVEYQRNHNGKLPEPPHMSEAQMMKHLLIDVHVHNETNTNEEIDDFAEHIVLEEQATATIENFFYTFQMIDASNMRNKIEQIYVVTSDFHILRAKYVFDTMFYNEHDGTQMIGNSRNFKYNNCVHFAPSKTVWKDETEKNNKYTNEEWKMNIFQQQTITTARQLWMSLTDAS